MKEIISVNDHEFLKIVWNGNSSNCQKITHFASGLVSLRKNTSTTVKIKFRCSLAENVFWTRVTFVSKSTRPQQTYGSTFLGGNEKISLMAIPAKLSIGLLDLLMGSEESQTRAHWIVSHTCTNHKCIVVDSLQDTSNLVGEQNVVIEQIVKLSTWRDHSHPSAALDEAKTVYAG